MIEVDDPVYAFNEVIAYFLAALLAPFTRCFDCFPKSLEVVFRYWSFCHNYSPYYILLFTFVFGYVYTILLIGQNKAYCSALQLDTV